MSSTSLRSWSGPRSIRLADGGLRWAAELQHRRPDWSAIETATKCDALIKADSPYDFVFGEDSPRSLAPFVFNLYGCLALDTDLSLPLEDGAIVIEKDLGARS